MIRFILPALVFLFFILEGTVFQVFSPERYGASFVLIPRLVLISTVIIGAFRGRVSGVCYGLIFGLLYDIVYTEILGVYMFSMGLIGYICSLPYKLVQQSFFLLACIIMVAVSIQEYYLYGMYTMLGVAYISPDQFFYERFLPTFIFNIVISIIIIVPLQKLNRYVEEFEKQLEK
ncbi:rod shape-determining protein MreD [Alkalihalobacterium bogoriense]|uniref:rod shape-determining protein MreD n=1 Tax=Alkalihalobacterium bogoriense TaxID=246272 RepID=UPI00047E64E4|nr:rod shape-determining protein MreD [Alkalihalobacterium bogoriense]